MITKEDIDIYVRFMFNVGETRVAMETIQAIYRKENEKRSKVNDTGVMLMGSVYNM